MLTDKDLDNLKLELDKISYANLYLNKWMPKQPNNCPRCSSVLSEHYVYANKLVSFCTICGYNKLSE